MRETNSSNNPSLNDVLVKDNANRSKVVRIKNDIFGKPIVKKRKEIEISSKQRNDLFGKPIKKRKEIEISSKQKNESDCLKKSRKQSLKDDYDQNFHVPDKNYDHLPPHRYIVAPMVGASELAFRLLCRKYGSEAAYTPMMNSEKFAYDSQYRQEEFSTHLLADHPLVIHVAANNPKHFADAAIIAETLYNADAIDLNLGCPQRTAYVGHYGSYLLEPNDRQLICNIISTATKVVTIPIFVKIRLLDTLPETIELVKQLRDAGASLIAIHGRYKAGWERKGPGARDGPAHLDQIAEIRKAVLGVQIISNGNTITWDDVINNLNETKTGGIMSAEGLLDNPALYLPRYGSREERDKLVKVWSLVSNDDTTTDNNKNSVVHVEETKQIDKLKKKIKKIEKLERKVESDGIDSLNKKERKRLVSKTKKQANLASLQQKTIEKYSLSEVTVSLGSLYDTADDKLKLATEYIDLATIFPVKMRTIIFHVRRILKDDLTKYQLMEECINSDSIDIIRSLLQKIQLYRDNPNTFVYDQVKAKQEKDAFEKKKREEGKRKDYEARMIRKAKREGKNDISYYLQIGAQLPTVDDISKFKSMSNNDVLTDIWKKYHSQHCKSFHLDMNGCQRGRTCAFLHVDICTKVDNIFVENQEIAG